MKFITLTAQVFLCTLLAQKVFSAKLPGQCETEEDCESGQKCISVSSNIAGVTGTGQCILSNACSGEDVGKCPTFFDWGSKYEAIQPTCVFVEPPNCKPFGGASSDEDGVTCYNKTITDGEKKYQAYGIYSCVGRDVYIQYSTEIGFDKIAEESWFKTLRTDQMNACTKEGNGDGNLCNGHGTCTPSEFGSSTYSCLCNKGYSNGTCEEIVDNSCDTVGQCGTGGSCSDEQCSCVDGFTGNQCTSCDVNSQNACNGHGTCSGDPAKCTCQEGYSGTFCSKKNTPTSGSSPLVTPTKLLAGMLLVVTIYWL